jgi:hypothetical protein
MSLQLLSGAGEFFANYQRDARCRWSRSDLAAQQEFVISQVEGKRWLDWSGEHATLELLQSGLVSTALPDRQRYEAVLLAGPIVEILDPFELFAAATSYLQSNGRVIGIIPCLRDNSPESQLFSELAKSSLRGYSTAEELIEMLHEAGLKEDGDLTRFVAIPQLVDAALKGELGFESFHRIFRELETQGYDPREVGWGELRFVAALGAHTEISV